ncbi:MAG: YebC/PmpR family DNA-binding transcriptional regulator [Anaerolineae bacterium]|nr:YebC/PmpR family DNA-binding transcriptional regulator [Anaerolineae bacterium]RIK22264.1 MAG: YebC/PmpR family DNA-binding transcriptional regulator [Anaerolineae bacterium]
MSGHSKWSTIKHKKAASDAKRGKVFTRIAKELTLAAREGGGDPASNTTLRLAVAKAKEANMPKDNIEKAIKRGTGEIEGGELIDAVYEAYGPHSVGILIEVVTDNRNRAIADVRHAVSKYGGNMAEAGAVSWQFKRKGYISITDEVDQDELFMVAAEAGADDIQFNDGVTEIYVELESFRAVQEALEAAGYSMDESSLIFDPVNRVELSQSESMQVMNLIDHIEELDDVQNVYSALEMSDEVLAAMEAA